MVLKNRKESSEHSGHGSNDNIRLTILYKAGFNTIYPSLETRPAKVCKNTHTYGPQYVGDILYYVKVY